MAKISLSISDFKSQMDSKGWVIFESLLPTAFVEKMRADLDQAYKICRAIQIKNKVDKETEFTLHHLIGQGESFLEYLELIQPINEYLEIYFQGKYILNSFGGAINTAKSRSYAHKVHRDIRTYSGSLPLMLNTLFMLDDFTSDNGSTFLMPGSHKFAEKPTDEAFEKSKEQALGSAGSLLVFNSNVWHRGHDNETDSSRRSVTPMFCKPYLKQKFDYTESLGVDNVVQMSEFKKQILGYYSRVPKNLDQWYQPPTQRMYRPDQG